MNLNIMSSSKLASLYGSVFKERGSGKIMITSSLTALASLPGASLYAATRGFVRQLGAGLRAELAPHGVVVTTLLPGATDTEFAARTNIQSALCVPARVSAARITTRPLTLPLPASLAHTASSRSRAPVCSASRCPPKWSPTTRSRV